MRSLPLRGRPSRSSERNSGGSLPHPGKGDWTPRITGPVPFSGVREAAQSRPFREKILAFTGRIDYELRASGEARLDLVPVGDLRLAEAPAQIHLALVHPARKIDQPGVVVFQFDAQALELLFEF